jgi:hypothetical protein
MQNLPVPFGEGKAPQLVRKLLPSPLSHRLKFTALARARTCVQKRTQFSHCSHREQVDETRRKLVENT